MEGDLLPSWNGHFPTSYHTFFVIELKKTHNTKYMIEWGQYPYNNKETLKQGNKGFTWHHQTPATTGTWKETFFEWSLPNTFHSPSSYCLIRRLTIVFKSFALVPLGDGGL